MKEKIKDIVIRAAKTFVQAFVASISVDNLTSITNANTLKSVGTSILIAGLAAGVSAVWNLFPKGVTVDNKEHNGGE